MARRKGGATVIDVVITPEQHERAKKSKSGACLIADAIRQQHPHLTRVAVDMSTVRCTDAGKGVQYVFLTNPAAQHLLLSFDQGWPQPIESLRFSRPVQIRPIRLNTARAQVREARRAELQAKADAGKPMTGGEKAALTKLTTNPTRPVRTGPVKIVSAGTGSRPTVVGGRPMPLGKAHPNLLRGTDRHFGAKMADPGLVFQQAVDAAVAERLAAEPST